MNKYLLVGLCMTASYQLQSMQGLQAGLQVPVQESAGAAAAAEIFLEDAQAEINFLKVQAEKMKVNLLFKVIRENEPDAFGFIKEIAALGFNLDGAVNQDGDTPFMLAIKVGNPDIIKFLLRSKTNLAHTNREGKTARQLAIERNKFGLVKLIDELYDQRGLLLIKAIKKDVTREQFEELLYAGANADIHDKQFMQTPLMVAAELGDEPIIRTLLDWGVKVDERDVFGRTALMWAAEKGYSGIVELLLEAGADATLKNIRKRIARDMAGGASQQVHDEIVKMLVVAEKRKKLMLPQFADDSVVVLPAGSSAGAAGEEKKS